LRARDDRPAHPDLTIEYSQGEYLDQAVGKFESQPTETRGRYEHKLNARTQHPSEAMPARNKDAYPVSMAM
jgi:hypothetical protein